MSIRNSNDNESSMIQIDINQYHHNKSKFLQCQMEDIIEEMPETQEFYDTKSNEFNLNEVADRFLDDSFNMALDYSRVIHNSIDDK